MSTQPVMVPSSARADTIQRMFRDFVILSKPRISVMVLLTVGVAGLVSAGAGSRLLDLFQAMFGLFLVSASGCAVNQYLERYVDWMMPRTARRPLPDQRLSARQVAVFGAVTLGIGLAWLVTLVNWQSALLAGATWILYVGVYTPMKSRTWLNTFVGAVAGALPVLVGSTAVAGGRITGPALLLFAVLYIWQFPHFMAIAWLYRDDYVQGNLRMASTELHAARLTGRVATGFAMALIPVSAMALWPAGLAEGILWSMAMALGVWYLMASLKFQKNTNENTARHLFRVSLLYLPLYLVALSLSALLPSGVAAMDVARISGVTG